MSAGKCAICDAGTKSSCSGCNKIFYCSTEHQKGDWKNHKPNCYPYKVCVNEQYGRYLVATKHIKAGQIVLKEQPIVCGPSQISPVVCVGCLKTLTEAKKLECSICGWPICSATCQTNPNHKAECDITAQRGSKVSIQHFFSPHPTYQCLTPLRCLYLKETDPAKWKKLLNLEAHTEQRKGSAQWKTDVEGVAQFIPRFFRSNKWSEEEILKVSGILQINAHEIPLTQPPYISVYDFASFLVHSCKANLSKSFGTNGDIVFWAPNDIRKDEQLSICYSDSLWGTINRQNHLQQTKLFQCECERCVDITEFGTYYSALKCSSPPCEGLMLPQSFLEREMKWTCNKCMKTADAAYVNDILDRSGKDLNAMNKGSESDCVTYIKHYSKWLPEQHFYITEVKLALCQLIGSGDSSSIQLISSDKLDLKIKLCKDLLRIVRIIAPGEARALGTISFELHTGLAEMGRRLAEAKNSSFLGAMEESLMYANQTMSLLKHEPIVLDEGQICAQAKINADSLQLMIGMHSN